MSRRRVLIVEDNPITRKMLLFALESEGYEAVEAGNAASALELAAANLPDLVVQDYVLPDMDGLQLLERFRKLSGAAEIPVLLVTGMVSGLEELRARSDPFTILLPKPLEPSLLMEIIGTRLGSALSRQGEGRRVLIVDDEPLGRKLAAMRLKDAGFDVDVAEAGEEALRKALAQPPDAILSDVLMPGMDGFLFCAAVRREPRLAQLPIVLLTGAYVEEADRQLAREAGANAVLLRTPDMRDAVEALAEALQARGAAPVPAVGEQWAERHQERVQVQLERQVARNEALLRQGAIQAAALSVVRGLTAALAVPRELPNMLADVLVHCLDAAGLSTGLLYLVAPSGELRLQAQAGLASGSRSDAASCFGHLETLQQILGSGEPAALAVERSQAPEPAPGLRAFAAKLGKAFVLVIPFVVGPERLGILVLASDAEDLTEPAWQGFARALAVQFGQAIALGRSLSRGAVSEARYQSLMEHANDAILVLDLEGKILEANREAEALLGRPRTQIAGRSYEEFVASGQHADVAERRAALLSGGGLRVEGRVLVRADGSTVPVDVSASVVPLGEETILLLMLRDVSAHRQAELRLQESEEQYRLLFESNPHPMWVYDPETLAFLAVNGEAVRQYGWSREEFLGMTIKDIRPPEEVPRLLQALKDRPARQSAAATWKHRTKQGVTRDVAIAANSITFRGGQARLVLAEDVTETRKLEAQLAQAQKMEAMGRLAGGVAHDFNNLLGVIMGFSELLLKDLGAQHRGRKRVEQIRKAADRAAGLTRQLLAFSRKQVLQPKVLDLNEVVTDMDKMLRRLIGEDIRLVTMLGALPGHVRADPGQIEQVIVNLAVNARDAMPKGGRLILETANTELDEAYVRSHSYVRAGPYVMLAVSDTGQGMDAATLSHLFEPFFTTKEPGKGTGLGLATVFGIVKQSGGHINVYSEPGKGSTFKVYLPRVDAKGDSAAEPATTPAPTGHETVLLVEDEQAIRLLIREVLESAGYTVLDAARPEDAESVVGSHAGPIQLLLTDVILPGMSGADLAARLTEIRPNTKVLFMSGYTDEAIGHHGVLEPGTHFLQKPFAAEALLRKVREVLDSPAHTPATP